MAVSESGSQRPSASKKGRLGSVEDPPQTDEDDRMEGASAEDDEEDGDEEEYEIEKILDAKRDKFGPGRTGYFVAWKGYGLNENSWVSQEDASNAQDLINKFWKDRKEKEVKDAAKKETASSKARVGKATTSKASSSRARSARKSEPADSDIGESASAAPVITKKRGRSQKPSQAKSASADVESEEEEDVDTQTKRRKRAPSPDKSVSELAEEDYSYGSMKKHMHLKSWEHLLGQVETVEMQKNNDIMVFFTLKTGERIRERASVCRVKFPDSMIRFYESNLRWRAGNEQDEDY